MIKNIFILISLFFVVSVIVLLAKSKGSVNPEAPSESTTTEAQNTLPPPTITKAAPNPASMTPPVTTTQVTTEDESVAQKKIGILKEILVSKNDNDPRLDTEFKSLSDHTKLMMRNAYKSMKPESFNEKGTVVFLLGRNITTADDLNFLAAVLSEPPCLSMDNCSVPSEPARGEAAHEESANEVTLAYPQIVSLKALETFLTDNTETDSPLKTQALQNLKIAEASKNLLVAEEARTFRIKYRHLGHP